MEKLRYAVMTKEGKAKSYVDKRWCTCEAYGKAHIHPKRERNAEGK